MDFNNFVKKIDLPVNFEAPKELKFEDNIAKPLTRDNLSADIEAVNSSLEIIRKTRGGTWPSEPVSEDFDLLDLAWHGMNVSSGMLTLSHTLSTTNQVGISVVFTYTV